MTILKKCWWLQLVKFVTFLPAFVEKIHVADTSRVTNKKYLALHLLNFQILLVRNHIVWLFCNQKWKQRTQLPVGSDSNFRMTSATEAQRRPRKRVIKLAKLASVFMSLGKYLLSEHFWKVTKNDLHLIFCAPNIEQLMWRGWDFLDVLVTFD